jgi:hypothetical protein
MVASRLVIINLIAMKLLMLISVVFIFGCSTMKEMQRVKFIYYGDGKKNVLSINIPKGARLIKVTAGGEGEEHRYLYSDSSVIYITSLSGAATLNAPLISSSTVDYNKRFNADTASFTGIDKNGLYWKEVKRYHLFYGYVKVSDTKKELFDKALNSAK